MVVRRTIQGIDGPDPLARALGDAQYIADEGLATAAYLALALGKPLLLEGAPGVGKTEAAKAIASVLGRELVRLQCYEGIDASAAMYEWNFPRQMLAIRQAGEDYVNLYDDQFLIARPILQTLEAPRDRVLLIDEIDRADHEFEAFLLEFLSDFSVSIPERGTVRAAEPPVVVLTSNRTRELHEALRRRCVYHWIDYPDAGAGSADRDDARLDRRGATPHAGSSAAVGRLRAEPLAKPPGVAETVEWAEAATLLNQQGTPWPRAFARAVGVVLKDQDDIAYIGASARRDPAGESRMTPARARSLSLPFRRRCGAAGFAVAARSDHRAFIAAVGLLGPRGMTDIRRAAQAVFGPGPDRQAEVRCPVRRVFLGRSIAAPAPGDPRKSFRRASTRQ